jgi:uncharacterized protein (TIGR02266 family)
MDQWTPPTATELEEMRVAQQAVDAEAAARARRKSVRLGLHANITTTSDTNFFAGFAENISEGGVFISTYSPPSVGEVVALRISVLGVQELIVQGEVRWIRTDDDGMSVGCGVRFCSLNDQQRAALDIMLSTADRDPLLFEA